MIIGNQPQSSLWSSVFSSVVVYKTGLNVKLSSKIGLFQPSYHSIFTTTLRLARFNYLRKATIKTENIMKALNRYNLRGEKVSSMKMFNRSLKLIVRVILAGMVIGWLIMETRMELKIKTTILIMLATTRIRTTVKTGQVSNKNQSTNGLLSKVMTTLMMMMLEKAYLSTDQNIHQYSLSSG